MKQASKATRGQRNNNPLNIRHSSSYRWQGEILADNDGFCRFNNLVNGVRAAFALLRTYRRLYKCVTIRDIITRWAPPTENHTEKYIQFVCTHLMMSADEVIYYNQDSGSNLVKAMAVYESNMLLDESVLSAAQRQVI